MGKHEKCLASILRGTSDRIIGFRHICGLLNGLGFAMRIRGSHHSFTRDGIAEILNLQPQGSLAKA